MSYCRFTEGDVYAYECDGGVQFYVSDGKRELDRLCNTFNEAYQYAKVLRDTHGLDVPSHAIEALKADALVEAARICGSDSVVAELEAENAKLRELVGELEELTDGKLYIPQEWYAQLKTEDAKLRELVRWMYYLMDESCAVQHPYAPAPIRYDRLMQVQARASELGVEVDG